MQARATDALSFKIHKLLNGSAIVLALLTVLEGSALTEWSAMATIILTLGAHAVSETISLGLAMGYGARLSYDCNIGAFFSGVASTSLHGWLWIIAALPGAWIGVRLRPLFGLGN